MRGLAPLVNQQVIHSASAVIVAELYKSIDYPSSGSTTLTKLPRKDNHICKSTVQQYIVKTQKLFRKEKEISPIAQEKSITSERTKRSAYLFLFLWHKMMSFMNMPLMNFYLNCFSKLLFETVIKHSTLLYNSLENLAGTMTKLICMSWFP